jgi:hypothetical protein
MLVGGLRDRVSAIKPGQLGPDVTVCDLSRRIGAAGTRADGRAGRGSHTQTQKRIITADSVAVASKHQDLGGMRESRVSASPRQSAENSRKTTNP